MAVIKEDGGGVLLQAPHSQKFDSIERRSSSYLPLATYSLPKGENRHYQQQYADMYFARLAQLKPAVESHAAEAFANFAIGGESARRVDRVLDVRQGDLCWVIGTCYMEMPLKPNVLEDLGKEHWIVAPPPRIKYADTSAGTQIMLEDESGRLRLTGRFLDSCLLVTGAIISVLGTENADGDFEVIDLRVPDLPRQPQRWEREDSQAILKGKATAKKRSTAGKLAIVSGLGISGDSGPSFLLDLLMEYLLGESLSPEEQQQAAGISRLVIAGNALSHGSPILSREDVAAQKKASMGNAQRKYGYDSTAYNAAPTQQLDLLLSALLPSIPITLIPGATDPTSTSLPQQPIHPAMFSSSRAFMEPPGSEKPSWFDSQTNPAEFDVDGFRILSAGGQTLDDIYRYVTSEDRLEMMEAMLRWRLSAPTAPDTLWCYPFQDGDAFVIKECPHVYLVGNQPKFETTVVEGPVGQRVRLITVPKFHETGELILLDMETLVPEVVKFELFEQGT